MITQSPESTKKTAETSQICPEASIQTEETDVRASKVQCDPQTTPKPGEKGHHRGWLIPVTINHISGDNGAP